MKVWIEKPVSEKPEPGQYIVNTKEGDLTFFVYTGSVMSLILMREQYTHYPVPIEIDFDIESLNTKP